MESVYILEAKRSAIGSFGGTLKDVTPVELGVQIVKNILQSISSDGLAADVDEIITGNVLGAGFGMNLARQIGLKSGLSESSGAYTLNRVCGSGMQAIISGAQNILTKTSDLVIAGGVESMSTAGFIDLIERWGARLGNSVNKDLILSDGLTCSIENYHMGLTAENLADKYEIFREQQDKFSFNSHSKAIEATKEGYFNSEIAPIKVKKRREEIEFSVDEHIRQDIKLDGLAKLKPAFREGGSVTAGNSSGINDGGAFLVLASEAYVAKNKLSPIAKLNCYASAGVKPSEMGIGPVAAINKLVSRSDYSLKDFELFELNEAFAAQSLAVLSQLEIGDENVNVCGGAVALGHPIGASGARIVVTLIHQLRRLNRKIGLASLCVGGGQGLALVVEVV